MEMPSILNKFLTGSNHKSKLRIHVIFSYTIPGGIYMKTINLSEVRDKIKELVQTANFELQDDVLEVVNGMKEREESPAGQSVFEQILENARCSIT